MDIYGSTTMGSHSMAHGRQVKKLREQFRFLDAQQVGNIAWKNPE